VITAISGLSDYEDSSELIKDRKIKLEEEKAIGNTGVLGTRLHI
jgi:hypothetical protein